MARHRMGTFHARNNPTGLMDAWKPVIVQTAVANASAALSAAATLERLISKALNRCRN